MSAHTCTTLTDGCYRCDLHRDEIAAYADSLMVGPSGVVHDPDCSYVNAESYRPWQDGKGGRMPEDRACSRCLLGELPIEVPPRKPVWLPRAYPKT